jgi:hypothetical protein
MDVWWGWWEEEGVGGFIAIPAFRSWTREVDVDVLKAGVVVVEGESTVGL